MANKDSEIRRSQLNDMRRSIFSSNLSDCSSYVRQYFEMFDTPVKGLNNYADTILEKVKNLNNVSHQWTASPVSERLINNFVQSLHDSTETHSVVTIDTETRKNAMNLVIRPIQLTNSMKDAPVALAPSVQKGLEIPKPVFQTFERKSPETLATLSFGQTDTFDISNGTERTMKRPFESCITVNEDARRKFSHTIGNDINIRNPRPLKIEMRPDNNTEGWHNKTENKGFNDFPFKSARDQLNIDLHKKNTPPNSNVAALYGNTKKSLGTRRGARSEFVPPVPGTRSGQNSQDNSPSTFSSFPAKSVASSSRNCGKYQSIIGDERLKQFQPEMIELILNEIMDTDKSVTWNDIAGLDAAKNILQEIVILPMLRPDIFTGLRGPPKGLLLFGPPGTGKTLIGKCIASHSKSTFFSISASSLTSKWVGEGEKMVRALFAIARLFQPAVIFIDEIDSLLTQRSESEHESSRRIKTEFLVQLDGVSTGENDRLLLVGATNRPQEIDEAARRRFVKRLYIPLPSSEARRNIIENLLFGQSSSLQSSEIGIIVDKSEGYSGADVANLCKEAAMGPIRGLRFDQFESMSVEDVRAITFKDFEGALDSVKSTVSPNDLDHYVKWNSTYGSYQIQS